MKIPVIKRLSREDLQEKDLPKWLDQLLYPLNKFIDTTVTALSGRLTFEENFSSKVLEFELEHDTELVINPQRGRLRVIGVLPTYAGGAVMTGFGWTRQADGKIGVRALFSDSSTHKVTLVILLGA